MMKKTAILVFLAFPASLGAAQTKPQPPETPPSSGPPAGAVTAERLDLDRVLEEPGVPWSIARVAQRAVQTVHRVGAAEARLDQAVATTQEARAAAIPRIDLIARYTRLSRIDNDPLAPIPVDFDRARDVLAQVQDPAARELLGGQLDVLEGISSDSIQVPRNNYNFRAVARYPLLQLFVEILPGIRAASEGELASRFEADVVRNAVALDSIDLYMSHARARGALAVAELAFRQAEQNRDQAEALLRSGVGNRPDLLRFEARVAAAERARAEARADVEATSNALRTLLDLPGEGPLSFEERLTTLPTPSFTDERGSLVERAWEQRDEMLAASALVRAREHAVRAARGSMAPSVGVEAGVDYGQPNPLFVPPNEDFRTSWNVSAVIGWSPDGTWSASRAKQRAIAAAREAEQRREQLRDLVRIEVVRAHAAYEASFESVRAAKRQIEAAEGAYAAKRQGFEVGVFDATEVIDAEVDVNRARLALIDAAARLRIRESTLRAAIGEHLWE